MIDDEALMITPRYPKDGMEKESEAY